MGPDELTSGKPKRYSQKIFRPRNFRKTGFQAFFWTNDSFFDMAQMELFGPQEPINSLEKLWGDFGDFDFRPESNFLT